MLEGRVGIGMEEKVTHFLILLNVMIGTRTTTITTKAAIESRLSVETAVEIWCRERMDSRTIPIHTMNSGSSRNTGSIKY